MDRDSDRNEIDRWKTIGDNDSDWNNASDGDSS